MRNLLKVTQLLCLVLMLFACTSDSELHDSTTEVALSSNNDPCVAEDPITRVINNGTIPFDFKVYNAIGEEIIFIPNIPANSTTSWASFEPGETLFILDSNDPIVYDDKVEIQMDTCMAYEIEIDSNNTIVSYTPINL